MSPAFIEAIIEYLPEVDIIFDRFHIVRMVLEELDELRRQLQKTLKATEGADLKGSRYLILANYASLKKEQQYRLYELLRVNEPLMKAYLFKE